MSGDQKLAVDVQAEELNFTRESEMGSTTTPRQRCDEVISAQNVDKEAAIAIIKLYHEMERLLYKTRFESDREIDRLRYDALRKDVEIAALRRELDHFKSSKKR